MAVQSILDPDINQSAVSGTDNEAVQSAIFVIQTNNDVKIKRDNINLLIQQLVEQGFDVAAPTGPRKITSMMLQQAIWRTMNRTKPLDFKVNGTGRPEYMEKIVTSAIQTVMDRGGYIRSLRDKAGAFQKMYTYGDAFVMIGTDPDKDQDYPIQFSTVSNSNIYVDSYATGVRSGNVGSRCTKLVAIFSMSWAEFCEKYPKAKKKASIGRIPRDTGLLKETERNYLQTYKLTDMIEVAHYYDIVNERYTCFAGSACTVISDYKGDDYPFVKDGEPYIPVLQYICQPAFEGFYNHGIGDMLYKLAIVQQQLLNMGVGHIEENSFPITLINVPQGESGKFFNKLQMAHEMRAKGKKGYVAMEYDPSNPNSGRVNSEALLTNNLISEWQIIYDRLDREIARLGINLDDINREQLTATQIIAEEENANAFVKQTMEYNASESQFAVEVSIDFIKKFCKGSKAKLNIPTAVEVNGQEIKIDDLTLGAVADELNKYNYYVTINARTGVLPSTIMEQTQVSRVLQGLPPGTPAWNKMFIQFAQLNGRDLKIGDLSAAQQQAAASGGDITGRPPMTETDRMVISPTAAKNPQPAM